MSGTGPRPPLRIGFVEGVTLRKWTRVWAERYPAVELELSPLPQGEALEGLATGDLDVVFVRLPLDAPLDVLSRIRLYGEVATLVVSRDSELADRESIDSAEVEALAGVATYQSISSDVVSSASGGVSVKDAVALVAAGVGSLQLPHSLSRLHARKDVVAIPISDAPQTEVAIVWRAGGDSPEIDDFIGVVRGRTAASSRGRDQPAAPADRKAPAPRTPRATPKRPQRRRQGR